MNHTRFLLPLILAATAATTYSNTWSGDADSGAADEIYLFYLHGRIIEDAGPTPTHPSFGLYDYPAIVTALGSRGATVVSEVRPSGTGVEDYARKTIENIERLIAGGVAPGQIVIAGFSKGGGITIQASNLLGRPDVRYVLLAACSDWITSWPELHLSGRVLSIYESSDEIGTSCAALADRGDAVTSFRELEIATGKMHGAFYLPSDVWMKPLLDWVHGQPGNNQP